MRRFNRALSRARIEYVLIFVAVFAVGAYLQYMPSIGDPDGFYHAKMALFLRQGRVLTAMPWMYFTTLRDSFVDHHFLYHALLVPFVSWGKPLLGVKLATATLLASFFTLFYATLKRWRMNTPLIATALLLFCNAFLFRLSLVKANSVSLIVFLLILIALFERRVYMLALLNALYVLLYGGWLLGWVAAGAYALCAVMQLGREPALFWKHRFSHHTHPPSVWAMVAATLAGSAIGLVVNPYWPGNLSFYLQQVWQIAIVHGSPVAAGGEWTSFTAYELIQNFSWVAVFAAIGFLLLFLNLKKMHRRTWTLALLAVLFVFFTLKSRRYIELSAPTLALFAASAWSDVFPSRMFSHIWHSWQTASAWIKQQLLIAVGVIVVGVLVMPQIGLWAHVKQAHDELANGIPLTRYASVSKWLSEHTPADSIIVQSDWDDWPMLFYFNTHNRYIVGLDPTFMYNADPALYDAWASLTGEGRADTLVALVTQKLASRYVLVEKDHTALQHLLASNIYFRLIYEDDEAWVYQFLSAEAT
ncbi:MAG: hypothetical protein HY422_02610 [Candidatus Komeilibacteria bacterium]|nr:hypothetical protein [Candidatus Komeilibacteria bacterium]